VTASEALSSTFTLSAMRCVQAAGDANIGIDAFTLEGAAAAISGSTIQITLTAAQRRLAIIFGGKGGGDGSAILMDFDASALLDSAGNGLVAATGVSVTETADSAKPTITTAVLDRFAGELTIVFNEIIQTGPSAKIYPSLVSLRDTDGNFPTLALTGATVTQADSTVVVLKLTPTQVTYATDISKNVRKDNNPLELHIGNAFYDIAGNVVDAYTFLRCVPMLPPPCRFPEMLVRASTHTLLCILTNAPFHIRRLRQWVGKLPCPGNGKCR
jgi:hypothetical protein